MNNDQASAADRSRPEVRPPIIDVHAGTDDLDKALRVDVLRGLTSEPKSLPPKWFYDEVGSELFDRITRLEEYYQTEAEREILLANAAELVEVTDVETIIELGSGTSDKTAAILDAATARGRLRRFVPFDVSEQFLRDAADRLAVRYPGIQIHGVVGDFDHHLDYLPSGDRQMTMILGGTIGNYGPAERVGLLADLAGRSSAGDHLLIGLDLVKDPNRLELAYDDPHGVTEAFNKNVLAVINRELGADFDLDRFQHIARFDPDEEWIEISLRSTSDQIVTVDALDLQVPFRAGELMRTEISAKFRPEGWEAELDAAGFSSVRWWTDAGGRFAVSVARLR